MKELFEQNKVLFLAVITALIIVFLVKKLIDYITKKGLEGIVQLWFDGVKDLLDDGKLNNSVYDLEDVEEVSREDKINHTTELDDGTWTNYAETPLPETDLEDPEEQTEDNQAAAEQEV